MILNNVNEQDDRAVTIVAASFIYGTGSAP